MVLAQGHKYKVIKQKPYCCVLACISIILDRRGISHGSQEEIGYKLGLIVPPEDAHFFERVRTGPKPLAGYGTQVSKARYSINSFFRKAGINLKETYYWIEDIKTPKRFIADQLASGNDIMVCFNYKALYGRGDWGHVSIIESMDNDTVTLIEPGKNSPSRRKVSIDKLLHAMEVHGRPRRGGLWIIEAV